MNAWLILVRDVILEKSAYIGDKKKKALIRRRAFSAASDQSLDYFHRIIEHLQNNYFSFLHNLKRIKNISIIRKMQIKANSVCFFPSCFFKTTSYAMYMYVVSLNERKSRSLIYLKPDTLIVCRFVGVTYTCIDISVNMKTAPILYGYLLCLFKTVGMQYDISHGLYSDTPIFARGQLQIIVCTYIIVCCQKWRPTSKRLC